MHWKVRQFFVVLKLGGCLGNYIKPFRRDYPYHKVELLAQKGTDFLQGSHQYIIISPTTTHLVEAEPSSVVMQVPEGEISVIQEVEIAP